VVREFTLLVDSVVIVLSDVSEVCIDVVAPLTTVSVTDVLTEPVVLVAVVMIVLSDATVVTVEVVDKDVVTTVDRVVD
jgi:hypothetical protein